MDNDGRLSLEEFILSGYLCELALKGEPLPSALPPNLVPPSLRKGDALNFWVFHNSMVGKEYRYTDGWALSYVGWDDVPNYKVRS